MWEYNVAYIAPAGHGKSLCFALPAKIRSESAGSAGVTLVVEPLKSIIDSQFAGVSSECLFLLLFYFKLRLNAHIQLHYLWLLGFF